MRQWLDIWEPRACGLVGLARTTMRRALAEPPETTTLRSRILDPPHARRRFGYRRIYDLLPREGVRANHKKVYRLCREAALSVRKRRRRRDEHVALPGLTEPRAREVEACRVGPTARNRRVKSRAEPASIVTYGFQRR